MSASARGARLERHAVEDIGRLTKGAPASVVSSPPAPSTPTRFLEEPPMTRRVFTPVAAAILLLASLAAVAAETPSPTTFVRGLRGQAKGGIQVSWYTHLGMKTMSGVRQQKGMAEMEWTHPAARGNPHPDRHARLVRCDGLHGAGGWLHHLRQRPCRRRLRRGAGIGPVSLLRQGLPAVVRRALHPQRRRLGGALLLDGAEGMGQAGGGRGLAGQGHGAGRGDLVYADRGRRCAAGDSRSRLGRGQRRPAAAGNAAARGRGGQLRLVSPTIL